MVYRNINLKLRPLTAYWQEKQIVLADNEGIAVKVQDKGRLTGRTVLLCNGKTFVLDGEKTAYIERGDLTKANIFELICGDQHYVTENLYMAADNADYEGDRLVAERAFYAAAYERFEQAIGELQEQNAALQKKVADLENGKFSILKFGGNEQ